MALADVQADAATADQSFTADLAGEPVEVKPVADWPVSAIKAVKDGDFTTWAEKCLTAESVKVWNRIDPTLRHVEEFFTSVQEATGQHPGK